MSLQTTKQDNQDRDSLVTTLERIEAIDTQIGELESQIKRLKDQREPLESLALEEMSAARMERGVPAGRRSWRIEWEHSFSVAKDRQAAVMEALRQEGVLDALLSVNTTSLKSWLKDRAKEAGTDARQPFSAGTPFEGIVGEYVRPKLRHTTVRRGEETSAAPF